MTQKVGSQNGHDAKCTMGKIGARGYTGCPKQNKRLIFVTLLFKNMSSDKKLSTEKNDTKIIWFGSVVLILQPFLETQSFTNFDKSAQAIYGRYGSA